MLPCASIADVVGILEGGLYGAKFERLVQKRNIAVRDGAKVKYERREKPAVRSGGFSFAVFRVLQCCGGK